MNEFGVQSPSLKKKALQPSFPLLQYNSKKGAGSGHVISFIGGKIKDVEGFGDRSAYGLPDETGVIILSIGSNTSLLSRSGLDNNDVIRSADGHSVKNSRELLDIIRSANGKSSIPVELMHNQVITKGVLLLK